MSEVKKERTLATPTTFSCYPHERNALHRLMREYQLKSVFDVVRLFAAKAHRCGVQAGDFCPPKNKS